jgi:hypothetical protein
MIFDLGRGPSFPKKIVHARLNKARELHLVSRRHGVVPIISELPKDVTIHLILQVHIVDKRPKLNKLGEMLHPKSLIKLELSNPRILMESL